MNGFVNYQYQGQPVTKEEFLRLIKSKMIMAVHITEEFNIYTGTKTTIKEDCIIPEIILQTQRFVGGPSMDYYIEKEITNE